MKFQPDRFASPITAYGDGWVAVAGERFEHSLILHSDGRCFPWRPRNYSELEAQDFERLDVSGTELLLFGSGTRLRFLKPIWSRVLIQAGIGIETMDTPAACRTYNILAGEGRRIIAALLLESIATDPNALE